MNTACSCLNHNFTTITISNTRKKNRLKLADGRYRGTQLMHSFVLVNRRMKNGYKRYKRRVRYWTRPEYVRYTKTKFYNNSSYRHFDDYSSSLVVQNKILHACNSLQYIFSSSKFISTFAKNVTKQFFCVFDCLLAIYSFCVSVFVYHIVGCCLIREMR